MQAVALRIGSPHNLGHPFAASTSKFSYCSFRLPIDPAAAVFPLLPVSAMFRAWLWPLPTSQYRFLAPAVYCCPRNLPRTGWLKTTRGVARDSVSHELQGQQSARLCPACHEAGFAPVSGTSVSQVALLCPRGWPGLIYRHVRKDLPVVVAIRPAAPGGRGPLGNGPVCVLQSTPSPCTTRKPGSSAGTPPTSTTQPRCLRTTWTTVSVPAGSWVFCGDTLGQDFPWG